jgi:hypothetical protein
MRNKYSKNFENRMIALAPKSSLNELLRVARCNYHYLITKDQLRQYLSKRNIKYKDYNKARANDMGKFTPLFSERIKPDGMIQIKIAPNKWEYKQRHIYSQYYGVELTENDYIIFLDQDRNNFNINNLKRITRHESAILANQKLFSKNKIATETGILVAKLTIKLNEKEKMIDKKKKVRYN